MSHQVEPLARGTRIQSVERAAALLRAVARASGPAASATSLAEAVGLNRTTTWRLLVTLEGQRLVRCDRETGWWALGFGLVDLAGQAGTAGLAAAARGVLRRLATRTGETAALAVLQDGALTYVAEATAGAVVAAAWQGRRVAVHATSTGKVHLAFGASDVRAALGLEPGQRLERFTPATTTSLPALEEELAEVRRLGYAVCRGEFEATAWGVSAPVPDATGHAVAVVSVWGPSDRLTEDRFADLGRLACEAAQEIAGRR